MKGRVEQRLQQQVIQKGSWSREEDAKLVEIVAVYGHERWNFLAQAAGLQRTGKSCRLRWLNYLRPNVRHGGFSLHEQLLILQLHFRWGNRWAKIAEQLPGRTDNDIKNYWRTRIIKYAKHLNCDVNSPQFKHAIRDVWIPTLLERITSGSGFGSGSYLGQAYPPLNSPQDDTGPDPNDKVLVDCTVKPVIECGSVGLLENHNGPVGFKESQNSSPVGMVNGPDFNPLVLEPNPFAWGAACEFGLEFDLEACDYGNNYGEEEDMFDWQEQTFDVA